MLKSAEIQDVWIYTGIIVFNIAFI